jgi:hypothetical protein
MTGGDDKRDDKHDDKHATTAAPPPPPSAELMTAIAEVRPVRTRRPARAFAWVAAGSLAYAALLLTLLPHRRDLPFLPRVWFVAIALFWCVAFVTPLAAALLPRPRAVLPDGARAVRLAVAAVVTLLLISCVLTRAAPPYTVVLAGARAQAAGVARCMTFALFVALVPLALGLVAMRRLLLVGSARLTAALGAAGGALGGLVLHVRCAVGGGLHVGLGHAGGMALAALVGAALGLLLDRRRA